MSEGVRYAMAPNGVFRTIQGEGALSGLPMVFVRLAGCSVGCPGCDTDYTVASRATLSELLDAVSRHYYASVQWLWLTGGEPTDHDLEPLLAGLRDRFPSLRLAIATAGIRPVRSGWGNRGWDFVSVSPHDPLKWIPSYCDQINLVPGLNGLSLRDPTLLSKLDDPACRPASRYVTPLAGNSESLRACLEWVQFRSLWRLGVQAHKVWEVD